MKSQWNVRPARPADAGRISEIHNEGIEDGQATLDSSPRTLEQVLAQMCSPRHHLFVAEWGGTVLGWASISPYSERECYAGIGEASVYIGRNARFQGMGRILLQALIEAAAERGYHKLIGRLISGNHPSRALCRSLGFREVGVHERHGRLGGGWVDVLLVERLIAPPESNASTET